MTNEEAYKKRMGYVLLITSTWYGKQYYFLENNGTVYSRKSGQTLASKEAYKEFIDTITEY